MKSTVNEGTPMQHKIYFITGGSGTGKSTLIPHLSKNLDQNKYEIHDFDERGVPANADEKWRISETKYWLLLGTGNGEQGKNTVVCGLARPNEIAQLINELDLHNVEVSLLDTNPEVMRSRLMSRYQTGRSREEAMSSSGKEFEIFIDDSINFAEVLRKESKELGYQIIDTTELSPGEVAEKVAEWIEN